MLYPPRMAAAWLAALAISARTAFAFAAEGNEAPLPPLPDACTRCIRIATVRPDHDRHRRSGDTIRSGDACAVQHGGRSGGTARRAAAAARAAHAACARRGCLHAKQDYGKPITLDLKNADLGAALQAFARFAGINIVASEKVRGQVSLNFANVPWRYAFDPLLEVNGLAMERNARQRDLSRAARRTRRAKSCASRRTPAPPIWSRSRAACSCCVIRVPRRSARCSRAPAISVCCPNAAPRWPMPAPICCSSPISTRGCGRSQNSSRSLTGRCHR